MRHSNVVLYSLISVCLILVVGIIIQAGCDSSKVTPTGDSGVTPDATTNVDIPKTNPDVSIQIDTFVWPDKGTTDEGLVPPKDMWNADGYQGGVPYGCQVDSDCFGEKCCPTPWGIKICAASCNF